MGDDIRLGSICFDFCSTNIVHLNMSYVVYGRLTVVGHWTQTDVITH